MGRDSQQLIENNSSLGKVRGILAHAAFVLQPGLTLREVLDDEATVSQQAVLCTKLCYPLAYDSGLAL